MFGPVENLHAFIKLLRSRRELAVIDIPIDPYLELAEIHRRVIEAQGPALLFTNVKGSSFPILTNMFGTAQRTEAAFGTQPQRLIAHLSELIQRPLPASLMELMNLAWQHRSLVRQGLSIGVRKRRKIPLECVQQPIDLNRLPMLTCWPEDGGAFLTLPLVHTKSVVNGVSNLGMYRMQRYDACTMGMHWQIGKGGGFHHIEAKKLEKSLPVTVMLGGPPALILSAIAPLPEQVSEWLLASLVLGKKIGIIEPLDQWGEDYPFYTDQAEFVFLGKVPAEELKPEGPFGDHYGYYSLQHDFPVFHCQRVIHRKDAIYPATVVGKPRQEDFFIGQYLQKLLMPLIRLAMPSVRDLWTYGETGFHAFASAVVHERHAREAMSAAFRILGEGQLALTKFLIVTDTPIDLSDIRQVLEHVLARFCPQTDLYLFANLSMDTLDYAGPALNQGSKGVMLGLGKAIRDLCGEWTMSQVPWFIKKVCVFCRGCLVVELDPKMDITEFVKSEAFYNSELKEWPLIIISDDASQTTSTPAQFLWSTFTRFDPVADIYAAQESITHHHLVFKGPIVLDARMKPTYPPTVEPDSKTVKQVDMRWSELCRMIKNLNV